MTEASRSRVLVIGNPVAGGGSARGRIQALAGALESLGARPEVYLTTGAGDGARRASELPEDLDALVVVGGDGSLNEILNGLSDPASVPLLQLPSGTANILARELGLPFEPEAAAEVVVHGKERRIDLGWIGERRFLMVVSVGFDAAVTDDLRRNRKGKLGFRGYFGPIARTLSGFRAPRIEVQVDDQEPVVGGWVVASKTRNYGGLFTVADRASVDSGVLDVCVFRDGSPFGIARAAVAGFTGSASRLSGVTYLQGTRVRLGGEAGVPVQVDGDYFGETPVELRLEPGVVRVLVP